MPTPAEESRQRTEEAQRRIAEENMATAKREAQEIALLQEQVAHDAASILPAYKEEMRAVEEKGEFMAKIFVGTHPGRTACGTAKMIPLRACATRDLLVAEGYRAKVKEEFYNSVPYNVPPSTSVYLIVEWGL